MKVIRVSTVEEAKELIASYLADGFKCVIVYEETYAVCEKLLDKHGDLRYGVVIEWLWTD